MRKPSHLQHSFQRMMHLAFALLLAAIALPALAPQATAAGPATITIQNVQEGSGAPLPFSRFMITDSHGTVYGPLETAPPNGTVSFTVETVDETTTFSILEETPPACGIVPEAIEVGPLAAGEVLQVQVETAFAVDCNLGALAAYLYSCPSGIDTTATDYAYWRDNCTEPVNGSTFIFRTGDSSQEWSAITGAYGLAGRAPIVGLFPGGYRILDTLDSAADPLVYCLAYDSPNPAEAPAPSSVEQVEMVNGGIDVNLNNTRIACDFFRLPADAIVQPTATAEATEAAPTEEPIVLPASDPSALEMHKLTCPAGTNPAEVNLFDACHATGLADITFSIEGPNGFADDEDTVILQPGGPGVAEFLNLTPGTYEINEETIPGDFVTVVTYCSLADSDTEVTRTPTDTGGITIDIPAGSRVICDWYNIPDLQFEPGAIDLVKRTCPVNYDPGASYDDLAKDCEPTDDVTFWLTRDQDEPVSGVTGADGPGKVIFSDLTPGGYSLYEDLPLEFVTPLAFCGADAANLQTMDVVNGTVQFDQDGSGPTIICRWYNIPIDLKGDTGSITIEKYLCPPGTTGSYASVCGKYPLGGTTFDVNGSKDNDFVDTTGDNGVVVFDGLPPGNYTVSETQPGGVNVAIYVVGCQANGAYFPFTYDDSTGLRINLALGQDQDVVCGWYNIPPGQPKPDGPSGSITVHKLLCTGKTDNKYNWAQDCETYSSGADFTLSLAGGKPLVSGTTNVNGLLNFTGLAAGTYKLEETSATWCHAEAARVDANGNIIVTNGSKTDVFIYNCSTKRVRALPATGTGPGNGGNLDLSTILAILAGSSLLGLFALLMRREATLKASPRQITVAPQRRLR